MRPNTLSSLAIVSTVTAIVTVLGLGACKSRAGSNPCLDKCTAMDGSSLERSTCELECKQTAAAPAQPAPPAPPVAAQPAPASDPGQPQPAQPVTTGPQQYAGDTAPRPAPPGAPAVRPTYPPPGSTTPATPSGPSMAELQQQRGRCESSCDADNTSNSDRATCRLQCAQITDRPATTSVPPATGARPTTSPQPAPADRGSIAACEANCNSEATPPTDRATCRLNCNATGSLGPAPTTQKVLHGGTPDTGSRRSEVIRSSGGVVQQ